MSDGQILKQWRGRTPNGGNLKFEIRAGLHYLKGNSSPYFTITATEFVAGGGGWQIRSGGCNHDLILKRYPALADLVALHCCDIDGAPMHAEANGWYDLAGALGGMGERYHLGNSERNFPIIPDPKTPWKNAEYRNPTPEECLAIFAEHCRIGIEEAVKIADTVQRDVEPRKCWANLCESMRPRWLEEAKAAIGKYKLQVYGDGVNSIAADLVTGDPVTDAYAVAAALKARNEE